MLSCLRGLPAAAVGSCVVPSPNTAPTVLCRLVVSLQMQKRKTTDKISIVPNLPNYSIVVFSWPESSAFAFCN